MIHHAYSNIVPDGTATTVVRPSDWNSAHIHDMTLMGNTAGASAFSANNVVFQGGANVTLSGVVSGALATVVVSAANPANAIQLVNSNGIVFGSNGSQVTASYTLPNQSQQPVAYSAGAVSSTANTLKLANSNGVSFSVGTQGIYASVKTDYAGTDITSNAVPLSQSSRFQQTSATSAITSAAFPVSNSSLLQRTADNSAFQYTSGMGAYNHASNNSLFQYVSGTSNITTNAIPLSQSSLFQRVSNTSAITSNAIHVSQSSLFTGGGGGGGGDFSNSTLLAGISHSHGAVQLNLTNLTGALTSVSNGMTIALSAPSAATTAAQYSLSNGNGMGFTSYSSNSQVSVSDYAALYQIDAGGTAVAPNGNSISLGVMGNLNVSVPSPNGNSLNLSVPYPTLSLANLSGAISTQLNGEYVIRLTAGAGGTGGGGLNVITYTGTDGGYDADALLSPALAASYKGAGWNEVVVAGFWNDGTNDLINLVAQRGEQKRIAVHTEHASTYRNLSETFFRNRPLMVPLPDDEFRRMNPNFRFMPLDDIRARIFVSGAASSNRSLGGTVHVGLYTQGVDTALNPVWNQYASASEGFNFTASSQSSAWNGPMLIQFSGLSGSGGVDGYNQPRALLMFAPVSANATWFNLPIYGAPTIPNVAKMYSGGATAAVNSSQSIAAYEGAYTTTTAALPVSFGTGAFMASASQHVLRPWFELFDPSGLVQ